MKVTPDFVPAVGGHGHRPQMQDPQARGLRMDQPTFSQVAAQVRPQTAAGPADATEGPGKSASSPAHLARAAIFASGAQASVPFGSIVSAMARGLELPVLDPASDGDGVDAPEAAAAGPSEPVPVQSDDESGPTVNPLEEAVEQVADNLGSGSAEAAMAEILDELLDPAEAAA